MSGQTTNETIRALTEIWGKHPIPDILKKKFNLEYEKCSDLVGE